ncbi:hypothetical protein NB640_12660 [Oxalobacter vibrioformis]|uniref:Uncharacterized protein n=1 Tax=Oxalobacter vibrioformis TaxID=933080 RepID=A0A9E9P3I4_9BURK|nr:hypothetical protein [Oxalobacter vibrioformis]WAW10048.1 hypothetical protein NB640_12660 [Oxalobacter vibrioformis]
MLKMPWLWDEGEYPKSKSELANPPAQAAEQTPGAIADYKPMEIPDYTKSLPNPFEAATAPTTGFKLYSQKNNFAPSSYDPIKNGDNDAMLKQIAGLKPHPDAWQEFQSRQAKLKTDQVTPAASTYPYNDVGQTLKPLSDLTIENVVKPTVQYVQKSIREKQGVELFPEIVTGENWAPIKDRPNVVPTPEADLLKTSKPVSDALLNTYKKDNVVNAMNAIYAADTLNHESDMANPNDDFSKGIEYTSRENEVSQRATQQLFNKLFSPDGTRTKEMDAWLKQEEAWLENNPLPELRDFWKIDWKKHPDKVVELGGKYFRQSVVGNYAYGLALSMIDSPGSKGNPILNQQVEGTMTGIARIFCQKDEILQAAIVYGKAGKPAEGWDFMVAKATSKLPLASSEGIRFLNRFLTQEQKEQMFHLMTKDVKQKDIDKTDVVPRDNTDNGPLPLLKKIMPRRMK